MAVTVPALLADAESTTLDSATAANSGYDSIGHLSLATSTSGGSITRYNATNQPVGEPQSLEPAAQCKLAPSNSLLGIDGFIGADTDDLASFAGGSIGVAEKKTGQSCSQVGMPAEKLVLTLNAQLRGSVGPALIESAELDIEAKQSARILATAMNGATTTGHFELQSGTNANSDPLVTGATVFQCSSSADSGPDAGAGDNCRWPISKNGLLFTTLILEVKNGSFSLEGGADGAPTAPSTFQLVQRVDGTLSCDGVTVTKGTAGSIAAPSVRFQRLGNATTTVQPDTTWSSSTATTESCGPLPYTLSSAGGGARFLKPTDQLLTQFVAEFTWSVPVVNGVAGAAAQAGVLPQTQVDFETTPSVPGYPAGLLGIGWCPDPIFIGTTTFDGVTLPRLMGIARPLERTDLDDAAGKQYACVGSQQIQVLDGDTDMVLVREQVYVLGDILLRKGT